MERPLMRAGRPKREQRGRREPVEISRIAAGGEGVGRLADGRVVFVHRTAPGDVAEIELLTERRRWARGRLTTLLQPSPDRRAAPCPYYDRCGGCTLEHLSYEAQLRAKATVAVDALQRIGRAAVATLATVPSPAEFRYRNRVSFTLRRLRGGEVIAGFHALHDPGTIVDLGGGCLLPEAAIARVWDRLRLAWGPAATKLPGGDLLRLTLRASTTGQVSLLVEGGQSAGAPEELLEAVEGMSSIWIRRGHSPPLLAAGRAGLEESWGDESFALGGSPFLQVNRAAARLLEDYVLEAAGEVGGKRVVDAYCGIGLHARRLARAGAIVTGIELDADAVAIARRDAPASSRFLAGRVENLIRPELPADLLIVNPPRAGLAPEAMEAILSAPPARILYVSCDPATLARDVERFGAAFELHEVRCFDLFPQTAHVESVAQLVSSTFRSERP